MELLQIALMVQCRQAVQHIGLEAEVESSEVANGGAEGQPLTISLHAKTADKNRRQKRLGQCLHAVASSQGGQGLEDTFQHAGLLHTGYRHWVTCQKSGK